MELHQSTDTIDLAARVAATESRLDQVFQQMVSAMSIERGPDRKAVQDCWARSINDRQRLQQDLRLFPAGHDPSGRGLGPQKVALHSTAYHALAAAHRRVLRLPAIEAAVERFLRVEAPPFDLPRRGQGPELALLEELYKMLHRLANPSGQSQLAIDGACFADIPLPAMRFHDLLGLSYRLCLAQGRARDLSFVDIGCGGGTKMLLARSYFSRADGVEYDPGYAANARATLAALGQTNCQVHLGDAAEFGAYDAYDVIYFYRPIRDDARLAQMERRIVADARPGTVLVAPYKLRMGPVEGQGLVELLEGIYLAGRTRAEADQIADRARMIGPYVNRQDIAAETDMAFMVPLIDALRALGFL